MAATSATEHPGRNRGSRADAENPSTPPHLLDPRLTWMLRLLGEEFSPLGVALAAAASIPDPRVLIHALIDQQLNRTVASEPVSTGVLDRGSEPCGDVPRSPLWGGRSGGAMPDA